MKQIRWSALLVAVFVLGMALWSQAKGPGIGFIIDREADLTWISDGRYAVTTGMSRDAVMDRSRARGFISALNAGKVRNFGFNDWRLPSLMELRSLSESSARDSAFNGLGELRDFLASLESPRGISPRRARKNISDPVFPWPVRGQIGQPDIANVSMLAINSMDIQATVSILSGEVVVNEASPGPVLQNGVELNIRKHVTAGTIRADSIKIDSNTTISGDAVFNDLDNLGTIVGSEITLGDPPVFSELPPFQAQAPAAGSEDISVAKNEVREIEAGDYGDINITKTGILRFISIGNPDPTGPVAIYNVESITGQDEVVLEFDGPAEVRVAGKVFIGKLSFVGPSAGSGVNPSEIVFYVDGINGTSGALSANPPAVTFKDGCTVSANIYAPNGRLDFLKQSVGTGALLARDIKMGELAQMTLDSAFPPTLEPLEEEPPVADPQSVLTAGSADLEIILTGSDPEGGDLTFSIEVDPGAGTLLADPVPIIETVPEIDRETGLPTGNDVDLPITKASVTYRPNTPNDLEDGFTFGVTDPTGRVGTAIVDINTVDSSPPPPPLTVVTAEDALVDASTDVATEITLTAGTPEGVTALTFSVESLPSGTLTDSGATPITAVPFDLPDATVIYTSSVEGLDSFDFQARDSSVTPPCGAPSCSTATITIDVADQFILAEDSQVTTDRNEPVTVTLSGNLGGSVDGPDSELDRRTIVLGADVAGQVSDSDDDDLGDGKDDLPGPSPEHGAAGVDVDDGNIQGVARFQAEFDLSALPFAGELPVIQSAQVTLTTEFVGLDDTLDTTFFTSCNDPVSPPCPNFDGILTESDFESAFSPFSNIVMPAPDPTAPPAIGFEGTFQFNVSVSQLDFLAIQGQVNENLAGQGFQSGLHIHSSASLNRVAGKDPKLTVVLVPGQTFTLVALTIQSLPLNGTLTVLSTGAAVAVGDRFLGLTDLLYTPTLNVAGSDSFTYQVADGSVTDTAVVNITVNATDNCLEDGRPVDCAPG